MKSTAQKIEQLYALMGTKDLNGWEKKFMTSCAIKNSLNQPLSEKQLEVLDNIYEKHFA